MIPSEINNSKRVVYYHLVFLFVLIFQLEYSVSLTINKNYGMPNKDRQYSADLFQPLTIPAAVISEPIDRRIDRLFWHGLMRPRDYSDEQAGTEHCAEWSNRELRKMGYDIWGDAWTRTNNPGLTKVISGYDGLERPSEYKYSDVKEYLLDAADNVKKGLDWRDLQEGDMVGMYFRTSPSLKKAYEKGANGEAQTHTGHVVYRNGKPYVAHNVHGDVIVNKAKKVMGRNHPWGIVSVYRPSKKKADGGSLSSRPDVTEVYKHLLEYTNGDFDKAMQMIDAGFGEKTPRDNTFGVGGHVANLARLYKLLRHLKSKAGAANEELEPEQRFVRVRENDSPTSEYSTVLEDDLNEFIKNFDSKRPADGYFINYDPEQEIKVLGNRVSTNMLDTVAVNAVKAGLPIDTGVGLVFRETVFGANPNITLSDIPSDASKEEAADIRRYNRAAMNMSYARNFGGIPAASLINDHEWRDRGYEGTAFEKRHGLDTIQSPLQHGFVLYKTGKYNPGERGHTDRVNEAAVKLRKDPNYKKWKESFYERFPELK